VLPDTFPGGSVNHEVLGYGLAKKPSNYSMWTLFISKTFSVSRYVSVIRLYKLHPRYSFWKINATCTCCFDFHKIVSCTACTRRNFELRKSSNNNFETSTRSEYMFYKDFRSSSNVSLYIRYKRAHNDWVMYKSYLLRWHSRGANNIIIPNTYYTVFLFNIKGHVDYLGKNASAGITLYATNDKFLVFAPIKTYELTECIHDILYICVCVCVYRWTW